MNSKTLLTLSALLLALLGLGCLFAPFELLLGLGLAPAEPAPRLVQLLGAMYLALAAINWLARGSRVGGIYNKPVAMGNFVHFVVAALLLLQVLGDERMPLPLRVMAGAYGVFALLFARMAFTSPVREETD